jgi:hypothetical protein
LVYVTADGGNTGRGPNSAIALMAAAGRISRLPPVVTINELTTVASIYSLVQFMDSPTATIVGAPPTNAEGLDKAFGTVPNPPEHILDSLGDILSVCVESSGPASLGCATLFALASPPRGTQPTNTRQALLDIAANAANSVPTQLQATISPTQAGSPLLARLSSRHRAR